MSRYQELAFSSGKGVGPFAAIVWALVDWVENVSVELELRKYGRRLQLATMRPEDGHEKNVKKE